MGWLLPGAVQEWLVATAASLECPGVVWLSAANVCCAMTLNEVTGWSGAVLPIDGCRPDSSASARSRSVCVSFDAKPQALAFFCRVKRRRLRLRVKQDN